MSSLTVSASGCSFVSEKVSLILCLRGVGSAGVRGTTPVPLGRLGPVCTILESLRSRNCRVCRVLGVIGVCIDSKTIVYGTIKANFHAPKISRFEEVDFEWCLTSVIRLSSTRTRRFLLPAEAIALPVLLNFKHTPSAYFPANLSQTDQSRPVYGDAHVLRCRAQLAHINQYEWQIRQCVDRVLSRRPLVSSGVCAGGGKERIDRGKPNVAYILEGIDSI